MIKSSVLELKWDHIFSDWSSVEIGSFVRVAGPHGQLHFISSCSPVFRISMVSPLRISIGSL